MKKFLNDYYNYFLYTICIIIFIISIYNIVINVRHSLYLNEKIVVSDIDDKYKSLKDNILQIEDNIEKNNHKELVNQLSQTLALMKNDGVFRLMPGDKLSYLDLYNLNNYFIDVLINEGWMFRLSQIDELNNDYNKEYIDILIKNADYLNKELTNNSNFEYTFNKNIRDTIKEEYQYILNNYQKFSFLIMKISSEMGDNSA